MATWHFDTNIKISENKWRRVRVLATPTSEWSSSMMTSWALYRRKARPRQVSGRSGGRQEVGVSKTRLHRASLLSSSLFFFPKFQLCQSIYARRLVFFYLRFVPGHSLSVNQSQLFFFQKFDLFMI